MNPSLSLDSLYFDWLYDQVSLDDGRSPERSYRLLCEQLQSLSFEWFVPNDDNRAEDGRLLRFDFLDEFKLMAVDEWFTPDCTIFELIVGLSHRVSFETGMHSSIIFFELLKNLAVDIPDAYYNRESERAVKSVIRKLNKRTYKFNGEGGLFPLRNSTADQKNVEIWYQMSAYLIENSLDT